MSTIITLSRGKRIRYAREAAGFEQDQLAKRLRVGRSTVSNWERDINRKPIPYAYLALIAQVTGFDVEFFEPDTASFSTIPDGGSPLTGVGAVTAGVTRGYDRASQVSTLRLAA